MIALTWIGGAVNPPPILIVPCQFPGSLTEG